MRAFPGAYGWGAEVVGGRSGEVRIVNNTNDSGAGSFRDAVFEDGPANLVFAIGGVLKLASDLDVKGADLYVAGQTARGGGFTIDGTDSGYVVNLKKHNLIMRYLTLRSARLVLHNALNGPYDIIVDHFSFSWGADDMVDIWYSDVNGLLPDIRNITIQNSLFSQPLSTHPTSIMAGGGTGGADQLGMHVCDISVHSNLFVNVGWRNPTLKALRAESVNNVIYNYGHRAWGSGNLGVVYADASDWVANYIKQGNIGSIIPMMHFENGEDHPNHSIYLRGNIVPDAGYGTPLTDPDADNWPLVRDNESGHPNTDSKHKRITQLAQPSYPVSEIMAVETYSKIPLNAGNIHRLEADGSWTLRRDSWDQSEVNDVIDDTGGAIWPLPSSAGIMPTIAAGVPYLDTDGDGMPDDWEIAQGLNPNDPSDGPIIGSDGYSNLERFLNSPQGGNGMEAIDNGDGTYTLTLTSGTEIGKATITGEVNGVPIVDIEEVDFTVGAADPATSEILAAPSSIPADGSSQSVVTVQLKDANGNLLTQGGDTVILQTDLGTLS